ncbi:YbfB/YjiJ family MFS transporter [Oxalobacteraceae bacterium OM1]|nr:YbfB/YjiJ family MFS transporter [Oxalobacteraceae bacterium OM1]
MTTAQGALAARHPLGPALAAAAILAVGMGFGRFAFTGLYPLMVQEQTLTVHSGTLAASMNYAGYLLGALLVARTGPSSARLLCLWATVFNIASMAVLAYADAAWAIIAVRGASGMASAAAMVGVSVWLMQAVGDAQRAPLMFAGVGAGIALSAELITLGHRGGMGSAGIWMLLALSSLAIAAVALPTMKRRAAESSPLPQRQAAGTGPQGTRADAVKLIALYGLAGFGYIVTATYLPLLMKEALPSADSTQVWAVFGLGAVPSCFLWHALHVRYGMRTSLVLNLVVQAAGVALPAVSHTATAYLISALVVGGTFMGSTTIALPAGQRLAHVVRFSMPAAMTAAFGVGQITGPLVANFMYARSGSFSGSLVTAAGALVLAAVLCLGVSVRKAPSA